MKNLLIQATKEPLQYFVVSSPPSCSEIHSLNPNIDLKIGCGGKKGGGEEMSGRKQGGSMLRASSTYWQGNEPEGFLTPYRNNCILVLNRILAFDYTALK